MGDLYTGNLEKKGILFDQPKNTGWLFIDQPRDDQRLADGNPWQMNVLHHSPDNRETRCFRREGVNLICPLPYIAEKTFNGIGRADIAVHHVRKVIIGQKVLLIFAKASYGFWIAFLILRFERVQIEQRVFFLLLFKDAC
jgi:hypothetical protein